jgi:hypothetical protein
MNEEKEAKNLGGRPSTLTREIGQKIINTVSEMLSINHAAEVNRESRTTIQSWIKKGSQDIADNIDSDYAWFSAGIKEARGNYIKSAVKDLRNGKQNWQATAWLLERCVAEDFGKDSELYKQLLDDYKMLMQSLMDQNKGYNHGRKETKEVDSERD